MWSATGGAGALLSSVSDLDPPDGRRAGRLLATDCRPDVRGRLLAHLRTQTPQLTGARQSHSRLFDASPRNALNVPFLNAAFPDATFIYVHRAPADALAETMAVWRAGRATTYPLLPGWTGPPWSFLLVPGWQELIGRPLAEIVTEQWVRTMRALTTDLEGLPPARWSVTRHDELLINPRAELTRLFRFLGIEPRYARGAGQSLVDRAVLPAAEIGGVLAELNPYLGRTDELDARARSWIAIGGN
jgi:hypothetical protein